MFTPKQLNELSEIADKTRVLNFDDIQTLVRYFPKLLGDLRSLQAVVEPLSEQDCWCQYNDKGELINNQKCTSCRAKLAMGKPVNSRTPESMRKSAQNELDRSLNDVKHLILLNLKKHSGPLLSGVVYMLPAWLSKEQHARFQACARSQGHENTMEWLQKIIEESASTT